MFDVLFSPRITIEATQESPFDEGELQIISVTMINGTVNAVARTIPLSSIPIDGNFQRGIEMNLATITRENPYFGYVIRAIERDNSSASMHRDDLEDLRATIENNAQAAVSDGGEPNVNTLWLAGSAPELRDRVWRDDDDKIGVSARSYPDLGILFAQPTYIEPTPGSLIPGSSQLTSLLFSGCGARWHMTEARIAGRWAA